MPSKVQKILMRLEELWNEAETANEQRYGQGLDALTESLQGAQTLGRQALDELTLPDTLGDTARRRVARQTDDQRAAGVQDLISRGLFNTTLTATSDRLLDRQLDEANQAIDQQVAGARGALAGQRAGLLADQAGLEAGINRNLAGVIEGRTDAYPDVNQWLNLLSMLGSTAGLQGGRTGGGGGVNFGGYGKRPKKKKEKQGNAGRVVRAEHHTKKSLQEKYPTRVSSGRGESGGTINGKHYSHEQLIRMGYRYRGIESDYIRDR